MIKNIVFLWILWGVECIFTPVVEVEQGRLRGLRSVSGQNRYYGIPYAVSERFQLPQEPPKWEGVFTAINRFKHCAQTVAFLTMGTEDCLHLDVYSPESVLPTRLPVLVFIHGGGYYYGTKLHYDPEFLVVKNVVVVVINYRVGILGFLCANGIANLGLWDQVAALKWIQKNIAAFGGDPDNVTVAGQSAGASSAAMHILSEASRGLFHKLFLMSGTPLTPWAFNAEPLRPTFEDARKMGEVNNEKEIYNLFANASLSELLSTCRDVSSNSRYFKYSPCVDSNSPSPFFRDTPYNIIKSGIFNKVPIMMGYANVEGMLFYGLQDETSLNDWNNNFVERLPSVFSWLPKKRKKRMAEKMRYRYFGKEPIDSKAIRGIVDYFSDWIAHGTNDAFTVLMSKYSDKPVYNYVFEYEGDRNFAKMIFGRRTGLDGASHSDDIFYVFKPAGLSLLLSSPDRLFIDRFTTMITNFMKYGDPTPVKTKLLPVQWTSARAQGNRTRAMRLGRQLAMESPPQRGAFWLAMLCKYGQPGYVPCD